MIRLKNVGGKIIRTNVTKTPISEPMHSPNPALVPDPKDPTKKIPNPAMFVESDEIIIKPGEVKIFGEEKDGYTEEQAEYLYRELGVPEDGGQTLNGRRIVNKNILVEVDEDEKEVKDNLFKKYRDNVSGAEVFQNTASGSQFEL